MSVEWILPYAGLPDEPPTAPPFVEVDIATPHGPLYYVCLLDSGASLSAFPASAAEDLGVEDRLVDSEPVSTAGHDRAARRLADPGVLGVHLGDGTIAPIAPYFLAEIDPDSGEPYPDQEPILGRDFFLSLREVAFNQLDRVVTLRGH